MCRPMHESSLQPVANMVELGDLNVVSHGACKRPKIGGAALLNATGQSRVTLSLR